jgi:hypothetical protein
MRNDAQRVILIILAAGIMLGGTAAAWAADPDIDRLLQSPVGKDWVTNGGNLTNQRYSMLKRIDHRAPWLPVSLTTWWCSKAARVCEMTA